MYRLRLSSGGRFVQVGADAGLLAAPCARTEIELWPAERADVVVDFSRHRPGSSVVLENAGSPGRASRVMRFDVVGRADDPSAVPRRLRAIPSPPPAPQTREVVLSLDRRHRRWVINGRSFDHERVDARIGRGRPEVWRLVNRSAMTHPIHFHNQPFRVLDRNGRPPPPWEGGYKDTVPVAPREAVRILLRFDRYLGRYVYHCHSLPHEDHDMMAVVQVVA
jgi:FtsP/CotA-like multicopper oxidase with cupredoxin domain